MTANNSKSYLSHLNKLVDQYSNTHHNWINKKPINSDYTALTEKLNITTFINVPTSLNNLKTKVDDLDVGKLKTVPLDLKVLSDM